MNVIPKSDTETYKSLSQRSLQRTREKQQNGKTRDILEKINDTEGIFHAKMVQ